MAVVFHGCILHILCNILCLFLSGYWRKHQIKDMTQTAYKYSYIPAAQEAKSSKCSFIYSLSTKYSDSKERDI